MKTLSKKECIAVSIAVIVVGYFIIFSDSGLVPITDTDLETSPALVE